MGVTWEKALVDELCGRRVIPFLGAGATMSCERTAASGRLESTPSWPQLLAMLTEVADCTGDDATHIETLTSKDRFLDAAQIIKSKLSEQEYSRVLSREFRGIQTGPLHDAILKLDQRVVMTTNYDSAYEDLCMQGAGRDGYAVLNYYDRGLVNRLRSPVRVILKLHGSVKNPEQTVLTRSEYFRARAEYPQFFAMIQSLFQTNTLLFVGYSLSDPDIQLLLESSNGGESMFRHYAIVPAGTHAAVSRAMSEAYGIRLIEYDSANGHGIVAQSLTELAEEVEAIRASASTT